MIYYIAVVDYMLMRRDAKRVAEWDIDCIIPCHGDVIESEGNRAWSECNEWFLTGKPSPEWLTRAKVPFMKLMRKVFLA